MIKLADGDKDKVFEVWHPNTHGHKLWAEYLIKYIEDNKIL
jgi:phospholipase/lecithinase/hemolysin